MENNYNYYDCAWCLSPTGGKVFCTYQDQLWGPPSLLYSGYGSLFWGGKMAGVWHWPLTFCTTEVEEWV